MSEERNHAFISKSIKNIARLLGDQYQPECIICFSAYHATILTFGPFMDGHDHVQSHYHLLMVTQTEPSIGHEVQDRVNKLFTHGHVSVIVHDKAVVEEALANQSRFFTMVHKEGLYLYIAEGRRQYYQELSFPPLDPVKTFVCADIRYEHLWKIALGFLEAAAEAEEKETYCNTLFFLHQAVEQACRALIRVHTAYKVDIHNLDRLLKICFSIDPDLIHYFPQNTNEDKRLFQLLQDSYYQARYYEGFEIQDQDVSILMERVDEFMTTVDVMCMGQIKIMRAERDFVLDVRNAKADQPNVE
jgi:HEPN domain-containing protein